LIVIGICEAILSVTLSPSLIVQIFVSIGGNGGFGVIVYVTVSSIISVIS
jgi:hypothetical protein